MSFVKLNENKRGGLVYIDPEKVEGYEVERETFGWVVKLYAGGRSYTLNSPEEQTDYFTTPEEAQEYLESWFTSVMTGVEELKQRRNSKHFVVRMPHIGDIYRILDRYWEVIDREPGVDEPIIELGLLMGPNSTIDGKKYEGFKKVKRIVSWFASDYVEYVGNREDIEQFIEQLVGEVDAQAVKHIGPLLNGFTGREEIVVHWGDHAVREMYCCLQPVAQLKPNAVYSRDRERVTCPVMKAVDKEGFTEVTVTHYANARDNQTRCCGKKYPLPEGETWTENANNVTCPELLKNQASEPEVSSGDEA